jgi:hypothetical protein
MIGSSLCVSIQFNIVSDKWTILSYWIGCRHAHEPRHCERPVDLGVPVLVIRHVPLWTIKGCSLLDYREETKVYAENQSMLESDMFRFGSIKGWMRLEVSERDESGMRRLRVMKRIETWE